MTLYPTTKCTPARAADIIEMFGTERIMVNSAGDWGKSDPLAVPEFILEMRRRGHAEEVIRKVVYDNPLAFWRQSAPLAGLDESRQRQNETAFTSRRASRCDLLPPLAPVSGERGWGEGGMAPMRDKEFWDLIAWANAQAEHPNDRERRSRTSCVNCRRERSRISTSCIIVRSWRPGPSRCSSSRSSSTAPATGCRMSICSFSCAGWSIAVSRSMSRP